MEGDYALMATNTNTERTTELLILKRGNSPHVYINNGPVAFSHEGSLHLVEVDALLRSTIRAPALEPGRPRNLPPRRCRAGRILDSPSSTLSSRKSGRTLPPLRPPRPG